MAHSRHRKSTLRVERLSGCEESQLRRPQSGRRAHRSLSWSTLGALLLYVTLVIASERTVADIDFDIEESLPEETLQAVQDAESADSRRESLVDQVEDSLFDPIQADPDCQAEEGSSECYELPTTTMEQQIDASCSYGGEDPDAEGECVMEERIVDKHWGSDPSILHMRDLLRHAGSGVSQKSSKGVPDNRRPPIFLMPGLASTRLVAWRYKSCSHHPLLSDIKVQDNVWLNINLIMQMGTIDVSCMQECLRLGWNQSDTDDIDIGCKLRPDEGLDAISSLSPGGIGSTLLVGGTITVYAWLVQWLSENLSYDSSTIIGLPYDWRMSPDKLEQRDGFLTLTRRRIEAAVQSNGKPGIMVAHSMGNLIFRYFLEWLRMSLREEAYERYIRQAERRAKSLQKVAKLEEGQTPPSSYLPGWMSGVVSGFDEWWSASQAVEVTADGTTTLESIPQEKHAQLWELAQMEGDDNWYEWIETHLWSYVGLSAPMLGAVNPLRAVISGENMGLPVSHGAARAMEITFGSTHTVNPVSSKEGFCDQWDAERWDEEPSTKSKKNVDARLACLDDIYTEIEYSEDHKVRDPWDDHPAVRALLKERRDWDTDHCMVEVTEEVCEEKEKSPCAVNKTHSLGPKDVQTGALFTKLSEVWKEQDDPLVVKREQLRESFWDSKVLNMLNRTWERPLIKHVIMAYGVDIPTEVGYKYRKTDRPGNNKKKHEEYDGVPFLESVFWEMAGGRIEEERTDSGRGLADLLTKKKPKRINQRPGPFVYSGDGSVPYLSLAWAHTWLLHAVRALRHSGKEEGPSNPLDDITISHRPKGATEWKDGPPPERTPLQGEKKVEESSDTGTAHPHGTKYKPEMIRFHNQGTSRTTGIEYTTTVIEAIGVEHKETTRNYDILAAVFTDILKFMHDDL